MPCDQNCPKKLWKLDSFIIIIINALFYNN